MSYIYKIESYAGAIDQTTCPPDIVRVIFPDFNGQTCVNANGIAYVIFEQPKSPVDLGPLVKVTVVDSIPNLP